MSRSGRFGPGLVRALLAALALLVGCYTFAYFPEALRAVEFRRIVDRVLDGGSFTDDFVQRVSRSLGAREFQRSCSISSEDIAILDVFLAGIERSAPGKLGDRFGPDAARISIRNALRCGPRKPFLWFLLFWLDAPNNRAEAMRALAVSYELGPNEGWLAPARIKAAIGVLDEAPPATATAIRQEYLNLVRDGFDNALGIFMSASPEDRASFLKVLADAPIETRKTFAKRLLEADIDAQVPGIDNRTLSGPRT